MTADDYFSTKAEKYERLDKQTIMHAPESEEELESAPPIPCSCPIELLRMFLMRMMPNSDIEIDKL